MVSKAKQGGAEHSNTMDVDARLSEAGGTRWRTTWILKSLKSQNMNSQQELEVSKKNQHLVVLVEARDKAAQFNPWLQIQRTDLPWS